MVAGEFCQDGPLWCNIATKKTLLSSDGGLTFDDTLAEFPIELEATCGVFLDDATFMVIGGRWGTGSGASTVTEHFNNTWLYDVGADTWGEGPKMSTTRSAHSCSLVTDCDGNKQGRNSIALLKSQQTFLQTFQQSF